MSTTHRLKLPLLHSGQAQKEITHNNHGLNLLDVLVGIVVCDIGVDKPPIAASIGELYIVGENPTAEFATHPNEIAQKLESGWRFVAAPKWLIVTIDLDGSRYTFNGKIWQKLSESNTTIAAAPISLPQAPIPQVQVQNDCLIKQDTGEYLQVVHLQEEVEVKGSYTETKIKIPHHSIVIAVTIRVIKAVQGASSFSVGTDDDKARYGGSLGSVQDTTNVGLTNHPMTYWYDKAIRITADNGSFTGGLVNVTLQLLKPHGPWKWD